MVERPRRFYIPAGGQQDFARLGSPAFGLNGDVVGVYFLRLMRGGGAGGGLASMMGAAQESVAAIILPAEDILDSASQVPDYED